LNCDSKTQNKSPADSDIVSPTKKKEIHTTLHKDENVDCVFQKKGEGRGKGRGGDREVEGEGRGGGVGGMQRSADTPQRCS